MEKSDKVNLNNVEQVRPVEDIKFKQYSSIVIAGMRGAGKTVLAVNILQHLTDTFTYHNLILFSGTSEIELNGSFNFIKPEYVFDIEDMDEKIEHLKAFQFKINKGKKLEKRKNMIIVFDDLDLDKRSRSLSRLFTKARHYSICIIVLVQYTKILLTPTIRSNIDVFITSTMADDGLTAVRGSVSTGLNIEDFYKLIKDNTKDNQFVMFNNNERDRVFSVIKASFFTIDKIVGGQKKNEIKKVKNKE